MNTYKRMLVAAFVFISLGSFGQTNVTTDSFQALILSDTRIQNKNATYLEFQKITDAKYLRILRNTVFARHGYIFKSKELSSYFTVYPWYKPQHENVDSLLSGNDRANLDLIKELELKIQLENILSDKSNDAAALNSSEKTLVGIWQNMPMVASGWGETYQFFANHKVIKRCSQMDCEERDRSWIGNWAVKNGQLTTDFYWKEYIEGGHLEPASGSCGTDNELVDGELKLIKLKSPAKSTMSLSTITVDTDYDNNLNRIEIDGTKFWQFSIDANSY